VELDDARKSCQEIVLFFFVGDDSREEDWGVPVGSKSDTLD
jgi:hypothetical protein